MFNGMIGIVVNSCICGCGFPVNFCFKALIGSLKEQIQKVDGGVCLKCGFELKVSVKSTIILCDLCGDWSWNHYKWARCRLHNGCRGWYHPADGRNSGTNMLVRKLWLKYIINKYLSTLCLVFVYYFNNLFTATCPCTERDIQSILCHSYWYKTNYNIIIITMPLTCNWPNSFKVNPLHALSTTRATCYTHLATLDLIFLIFVQYQSRWSCCLMRKSAAAGLRVSRVRIPMGAWLLISCVCVCVLRVV
jgi:hypothetical protein